MQLQDGVYARKPWVDPPITIGQIDEKRASQLRRLKPAWS